MPSEIKVSHNIQSWEKRAMEALLTQNIGKTPFHYAVTVSFNTDTLGPTSAVP